MSRRAVRRRRGALARPASRDAFTLIELLLVVFILALVAASASSVLDDEDQQLRWDDTRRRAEAIRQAIVGHPERPTPNGYVADVGALPGSIQDLIAPPTPPAGWRGPYLHTLDGRYHDGWGNGLAQSSGNFGWDVQTPADETWIIRSFGADGALDPSPLPADFSPFNRDLEVRIEPNDHRLPVQGWSIAGRLVGAAPAQARLRLRFPGDTVPLVSDPATPVQDPVSGSWDVVFTFSVARTAPIGTRTLEVVDLSDPPVALGPAGQAQPVELWPRAALPARLPAPWRLQ